MDLVTILDKAARGATYYCGNGEHGFDGILPSTIRLIILIIEIGIPVLLVILGMFDLGKAVTAQKEDEIKKSQQLFVKRLVSAILVFFVFFVVKLVIGWAANNDGDVINCMNCFVTADIATDSCYQKDANGVIINPPQKGQGQGQENGNSGQDDADTKQGV